VIGSFSRDDFLPRDKEFSDQERISYREGVEYRQTILTGLSVGARAAYSQTKYTASTRNNWNQEDYSVFADFGAGKGIGVGDESGLAVRMSPFTRIRVGAGYSAGYSVAGNAIVASGTAGDTTADQLNTSQAGTLTGFGSLTTDLRKDLSHTFDYRHGLRTGFRSDYELFTAYGYQINWRGALESASFFTRVTEVEPGGNNAGRYRDWATGLNGTYPLLRVADLIGSSTYTVRYNEDPAQGAEVDPELKADYATWASRIGTSFSITKSIGFLVYFEHIERTSNADVLNYVRDIFEAIFTYRHQF
jgi:hypothetical protein